MASFMEILNPDFGEDWSVIVGVIRKYLILSHNSQHLPSLTWLLISKRIFRSIATKRAVNLSKDPNWCIKMKNIKLLPAKKNLETKSHFDLFTSFNDFSYFNTIIFKLRFYFSRWNCHKPFNIYYIATCKRVYKKNQINTVTRPAQKWQKSLYD